MPKNRCQKPNAKYCMPKKKKLAKNQMLKKFKHDMIYQVMRLVTN